MDEQLQGREDLVHLPQLLPHLGHGLLGYVHEYVPVVNNSETLQVTKLGNSG